MVQHKSPNTKINIRRDFWLHGQYPWYRSVYPTDKIGILSKILNIKYTRCRKYASAFFDTEIIAEILVNVRWDSLTFTNCGIVTAPAPFIATVGIPLTDIFASYRKFEFLNDLLNDCKHYDWAIFVSLWYWKTPLVHN